ncbi:MAG: amidinotransferase [Chloroflexota bacterium]|nr:MAG: amidinotransferase [Chloroflexota bacterium]
MVKSNKNESSLTTAYGGEGWSPRIQTHQAEIGSLWGVCGVNNEYAPLEAVLLHAPGAEWEDIPDPDAMLMANAPDLALAREQHDAIAQFYRGAGVNVHYVEPNQLPPPNLMFCADLFFMTPEGAILARPASTVRAGEERWIARRLADLGIPIARTLRGGATFEGADAQWLNSETVLIAHGLRTNAEGVSQVSDALRGMGVDVIQVDLPIGTMHLMGMVRFLDKDLAVGWLGRLSYVAVEALRARGYRVIFIPNEAEAKNHALNFVTLGPKEIFMAAGKPITQKFYESQGVTCHTVETGELNKAAGGIGCLTGILRRAGN